MFAGQRSFAVVVGYGTADVWAFFAGDGGALIPLAVEAQAVISTQRREIASKWRSVFLCIGLILTPYSRLE